MKKKKMVIKIYSLFYVLMLSLLHHLFVKFISATIIIILFSLPSLGMKSDSVQNYLFFDLVEKAHNSISVKGDIEESLTLYQKSTTIIDNDTSVIGTISYLYELKENWIEAKNWLQKKRNVTTNNTQGQLNSIGQVENKILFLDSLSKNSLNLKRKSEYISEIKIQKATIYLFAKKIKECYEEASFASTLNPKNYKPYYLMAECMFIATDFSLALSLFTKTKDYLSNDQSLLKKRIDSRITDTKNMIQAFGFINSGNKQYKLKNYSKALFYFDQALNLNKSNNNLKLKIAFCYYQQKNWTEAISFLNQIIDSDESSVAETALALKQKINKMSSLKNK